MKKFYIQTLGCKVNQYESDGIAMGLEAHGWIKRGKKEPADVVIINTCAVTSKAGMQSRQAIRKLIRENPDARVIVTGCHAQTGRELIQKIDHIDEIVCHRDKTRIADHICRNDSPFSFKQADHTSANTFESFPQPVQGEMTRAYLKIQDGCNAFCTYCIVPYARGGSVSMPEEQVFQHLSTLNRSGFKEVILTGIHTGMYGLDLGEKTSLLQLLERINREKTVHRIRLSSIEPGEINEDLICLAQKGNVLCDHFHIPLQSGDDAILKRMKRPYTTAFFEKMVRRIHTLVPGAGIGIDVLIGFPSETDQQFENTFQLIKRLPISYMHIFPFSARKGTPAYHFDQKVDAAVIKERCERMRNLDREKRRIFISKNLNTRLEGLVQHQTDAKSGCVKAVTSNYLTIFLGKNHDMRGKIVDLVPEQCDSSMNVKGRIVE